MNKYLAIFAMILLLGGCATVRDVDGNRYKTVKINGMQWMAENLRATHYAEGIALLDKWLSDKEKTCYQILEYNEKDFYKSALRAVWRLGGRAVGK